MSKLLRGLILLGAVGLVVALMVLLGSRSASRVSLRNLEAQMRAQGEKLAFSELPHGQRPNAVDSHAIITNAAPKLKSAQFNPAWLIGVRVTL